MFGNKERKQQKQIEKENAILQKYGLLDFECDEDKDALRNIANNLAGTELMKLGASLSAKAEENIKINYLYAAIEQNFIIIRQLDKLTNLLKNIQK